MHQAARLCNSARKVGCAGLRRICLLLMLQQVVDAVVVSASDWHKVLGTRIKGTVEIL